MSYGPAGDQRVELRDVLVNDTSLPGQTWISLQHAPAVDRSDHMVVRGKLSTGCGNISASMFNAQLVKAVRPQPGDIGLHIRDWFATAIRRAIPEPQASLATGFLVGQHSTLPEDLTNQLKLAGLTHIVVASGYNLTILVGIARRIFLRLSKYLAFLVSASMMGGFVMISGLSPSMSRAALVTSLGLAAWYYGRSVHPFVLLVFTAAITALINPSYVWGDIGWYLSFTSFAGVIILAPVIRYYFWKGKHAPNLIVQIVIDTLSAQLATLPVIMFTFGQYSPYALLANILVLPFIPLVMLLTFGAGIGALLLPSVASAVGLPANFILHYMTGVIGWVAGLPGSAGMVNLSGWTLAISYAFLVLGTLYLWRRSQYDFRATEEPEQI